MRTDSSKTLLMYEILISKEHTNASQAFNNWRVTKTMRTRFRSKQSTCMLYLAEH